MEPKPVAPPSPQLKRDSSSKRMGGTAPRPPIVESRSTSPRPRVVLDYILAFEREQQGRVMPTTRTFPRAQTEVSG